MGDGDKWKYTDVIVMVRGALHYPVSDKFDAYGGVGLGMRYAGVSFEGNSLGTASSTAVTSGLFVGGRYFFAQNIGAFAELGYDQSYRKIGLTAKF
ncbi:outer membrane beta-barrel protein [Hymenobacter terricola]|uniref:outer membrane beta-barrel protein n=1 Tax=Hymenobacter terricola TaxID=2819236 RepID=UPI001B30FD5B|nr:outer membrane beta-barrel protein [Hymenobacter terricola]